jgi:hypothetical protein
MRLIFDAFVTVASAMRLIAGAPMSNKGGGSARLDSGDQDFDSRYGGFPKPPRLTTQRRAAEESLGTKNAVRRNEIARGPR